MIESDGLRLRAYFSASGIVEALVTVAPEALDLMASTSAKSPSSAATRFCLPSSGKVRCVCPREHVMSLNEDTPAEVPSIEPACSKNIRERNKQSPSR